MRWILWIFGLGKKRPHRHLEWHPVTEIETEVLPVVHSKLKSMEELMAFWQENSPRGRATTRKLQQSGEIRRKDLQL
jgi:hypothetical protein